MKILLIVHSFPPFHWRGTEVYALELARALADLGHEPHVFYLRHDVNAEGVVIEDDEFEGLPVHRARMNVNPADPESYFFGKAQEEAFADLLDRLVPEVVHFLYFTGGLSLNLAKTAVQAGKKLFVTVTDFSGLCPRGQLLDREGTACPGPREGLRCMPCLFDMAAFTNAARLDKVLREYAPLWLIPASPGPELALVRRRLGAVRDTFKAAQLTIFPNPNTQRLYHHADIRGTTELVMDYGIDASRFKDHRKTDAGGAVRIGFIGQLLPHKGLATLAAALDTIPDKWRIVLHGSLEDPGAKEYFASISWDRDKVEFRGTFPFEKMNEVLEGIDILVVPSNWDENCPLIVKYALATGTWAVLADQPGMVADRDKLPEWVSFFRPADGSDLRKTLERAAASPAADSSGGSSALERVLELGAIIEVSEQAKNMIELYKEGE